MTVSPTAEKALRQAMARLIAGIPRHTDGALAKNNLCKEAQVSRATMNRATSPSTAAALRARSAATPNSRTYAGN